MFHVVTGDGWPAADEGEIHDLGRLWLQTGAQLLEFAPEMTRSATYLAGSGALVGDGQRALAAAVAVVTGDGDLTLQKLAAGFEELGRYLQRVAVQTQYLKIIVIEELVILAAQIAYLIAMIPWTFGASAAGIAGLQIFGRQFALAVLRQLAIAIAAGEVLQVGLDAIAQLAQVAEGWRAGGQWDWDLTRSVAITGVVGGVLGPVFHGLGHYPSALLTKALGGVAGRKAGRNAGREVARWAADAVTGAGHEYVTDGTSSLVQGGGWRPDTFSLTAGAADEATTGLSGIGRRKRHLTTHRTSLTVDQQAPAGQSPAGWWRSLVVGGRKVADGVTPDRTGATARAAPQGPVWESGSAWPGSMAGVPSVVVTGRAGRPEVPDLTGFWDPGPSHRVTVLDGGTQTHHDTTWPAPDPVTVPGPIEVDAGQAFTLDDLAPLRAAPTRRSDEEKLALLADYEQAASQRQGRAWRREHGIRSGRLSEWRRLRDAAALPGGSLRPVTAPRQAVPRGDGPSEIWVDPAVDFGRLLPTDHDTAPSPGPGPVAGSVAVPGPIEVDAGQAFTLDDLAPLRTAPTRRSDEEKLALLADYEQAASQRGGRAWLREHGICPSHILGWRRLRETAALPVGDPRLAGVASSSLSLPQKAGLVREYQDAALRGQQQQWLADRNLTRRHITRWQAVVRSTQPQAAQPAAPQQQAIPSDQRGSSEIFVDPAADFAQLLSPTDHHTAPDPASGSVAVPALIEVDEGQTFTLDDLVPVPNRYTRRSLEERLALLADYEQAVSRRNGNTWLREHGISASLISGWRRLRDTGVAGDGRAVSG